MLLKILRYFRGGVFVRVFGGFFESFINECNREGIKLREVSYVNGDMYFFTTEQYLLAVKKIADKSGLESEVKSCYGLPYLIKENKDRIVLFAGTFLAICFVWAMNSRVWLIQVSGNDKLFDSQVLQVMNELGIKVGSRKSKINAVEIQKQFLEKMKDDVIWVSLNIEGMCAEIQIREIEKVKDDSIHIPCNYVANFSGTITTYRVFSGTPVVNKGSYVRQGDLLISSVVEYYDGGLDFTESRGEIIGRHNKTVEKDNRAYNRKRIYTSTKEHYGLIVFLWEIPLYFESSQADMEITSEKRILSVNGKNLPFGIVKYTYSYFEEVEELCDDKVFLLSEYVSYVELQVRQSNVISVETVYNKSIGDIKYSGKIDCLDYMGEKVAVTVEKNK